MLSRRNLIKSATLASLAFATTGSLGSVSYADPDPPVPTPGFAPIFPPGPEIYVFKLGSADIFVIRDGTLASPSIQPLLAPEGSPEEINKLLKAAFLPTDHLFLSFNVMVIKLGSEIVLIDTGGGVAMGALAGRLSMGLAQLGFAPNQITSIVLTHAHVDHVGGLLDASGKSVYPNAKIFIADNEANFWLGDVQNWAGSRLPFDNRTQAVAGARKYLNGVSDQLQKVSPGKQLFPGVSYIPAPGHTPGHQAVLIESDGESLIHIADSAHHQILQFVHPEWTIMFDTHPDDAIATRIGLLGRAATQRRLIASYHLPFPGLGHVRIVNGIYEWVPRPWVD